MTSSVGVVDTRRGNLLSIRNALHHLGADVKVCGEAEQLADVDRVVLPGVGSFRDAIEGLRSRDFPAALDERRAAGAPILGVCLGMQLLARWSDEGGGAEGLGWIDADVRRLETAGRRVPHMGWNDTEVDPESPLFKGLARTPEFYFVHSFRLVVDDEAMIDATCDYGGSFPAAIRRENIAAVQFHPEKSQDHGLQVLDNFLRWKPGC
jgi:glutamine amidotransferase